MSTIIAVSIAIALLLAAIIFCVATVIITALQEVSVKNPAASSLSPCDADGVGTHFDFPGRSAFNAALRPASPPGLVTPSLMAATRGRTLDFANAALNGNLLDLRSAKSVAVTIEEDKVRLEVDGWNVFRAYNIGIIQVDDRRVAARGDRSAPTHPLPNP